MKYRILTITFVLTLLAGCTFPALLTPVPTAATTSTPATPVDTAPPPLPTPELGTVENPLILALAPTSTTPEQINAARELAANFTERTGYAVVVVAPDSQTALVEAIENGNAHIVLLDALAYAITYQAGLVNAVYAVEQDDGKITYGAQFIASRKSGFQSYFDETTETNTAEAAEALAQFAGKKPCWSDETSPSGYIIPLGYLNKNLVNVQSAAFVQGQPTVVRSIYAGGICDFGATYSDARKFPSLEDQYPDLMEQVKVIWRIPEIIPYPVIALSIAMPEAMRNLISATIPAIMQTERGKAEFEVALGIKTITSVNDAYFNEFHLYMVHANIQLNNLIK